MSIDVKSTPYLSGKLMFKSADKFRSDIAVLAIEIGEDVYRIPGWIRKENFDLAASPFMNGIAVEQADLQPPNELWELMTNKKNQKI